MTKYFILCAAVFSLIGYLIGANMHRDEDFLNGWMVGSISRTEGNIISLSLYEKFLRDELPSNEIIELMQGDISANLFGFTVLLD